MTQTSTPPPAPTPAPPPDSVTLSINGRSIETRKGTLLVEAAREAGIPIPVFCYHPKLKPVGACRMCLVQVEKMPRLQTACTTPVAQDMVVRTDSPDVIAAQNGVIELLLANHPLDCPICDKGGECPLQDNTFEYGLGKSRFSEEKQHKEKALPLSDRIVLDRERCIMCYRCVRFHQEISGDEALAAIQRGGESEIGTLEGEPYDSIFSGNTIEICPVGALTSRTYRFKARPWDLVRTPSVCSGCAVGCNVEVHSRTEQVLRIVSRENKAVDDGWLCDIGRFNTVPTAREQRAERPLVRGASGLDATTWDAALGRAADLLKSGPTAILASPSLSNEALWLLQGALGQALPNTSRGFWPAVGSQWPVEGAIANLPSCKTIVLAGLDAWNELPVLALWIHKAALKGAKLVVIGASNGQFRDTGTWLRTPLGWEADVAAQLVAALQGGKPQAVGDVSAAAIAEAAASLASAPGGPAALLAGPLLAAGQQAQSTFEALARAIGADGQTGLVGAPSLAANGRGAQELAGTAVTHDPMSLIAQAQTVLLIGDEPWGELDTGTARVVLATSRAVPNDARFDTVLPLAHAYERQGSVTNLEGRVQLQEGGALPPQHARADWSVLAGLVRKLGGQAPERVAAIREELRAARPNWAEMLQPVSALPTKPAWEAGVQRG